MNLLSIVGSFVGNLLGGAASVTADVLQSVLMGVLSGLPDGGGLPLAVHTAAIDFGNSLTKVNFILPVDTLMTCLVVIITLKMGLFGFHWTWLTINWVRGIPTGVFSSNWLPDDGGQRSYWRN